MRVFVKCSFGGPCDFFAGISAGTSSVLKRHRGAPSVVGIRVKSRSPLAGARSAGLDADTHNRHNRSGRVASISQSVTIGAPSPASPIQPYAPGPDPVLAAARRPQILISGRRRNGCTIIPVLGASGLASESQSCKPAYCSHPAMRSRALGSGGADQGRPNLVIGLKRFMRGVSLTSRSLQPGTVGQHALGDEAPQRDQKLPRQSGGGDPLDPPFGVAHLGAKPRAECAARLMAQPCLSG